LTRPEARARLKPWWQTRPPGKIISLARGDLVAADALGFLRSLKPGIADVIFLDPPFNLGKRYGRRSSRADRLDDSEYANYLQSILDASAVLLAPGGSLFLYHYPKWAMRFASLLSKDLSFVHWIAISMKNGFVRGARLYPAHYALLHFAKGRPKHLARPKISPLTCRHCGEYVRDYGGYRSYIEDGVNLSDVWDDISPVRHSQYKSRVSNELPIQIPLRALQISGAKNGVLIDPFAGAGTSLVAARLTGMRFIACDREQSNIDTIRRRLTALVQGGRHANATRN